MSDFRAFLAGLFASDAAIAVDCAPVPQEADSAEAEAHGDSEPAEGLWPVAPDWRAAFSARERTLFPRTHDPPAEWLETVLAVRELFGGELESIRPGIGAEELPEPRREWFEERTVEHCATPLSEHIAAYVEHLKAKGVTAARVKQTDARLKRVADGCKWRLLGELSGASLESWLAEQRDAGAMHAANWNAHRSACVAFAN